MRFQCPFCSFILKDVTETMLGDKVHCVNCGRQPYIPADSFGPGRIMGDFIISDKIGQGSIGTVYLARQISLDRVVALKVISEKYKEDKELAAFLAEARAAARLSHPNLMQSLAVGEEENAFYMAMTYIRGETVRNKIEREGKIAIDESLHIVQQVAEALHFAWEEAKLIHRDVKPDNIMINEDGIIKLTDLGLAMHQRDWHKDMEISGSPSYMSPEQFIGEKLDSRSDIYSLGISLYQMLSGKLPFNSETVNTMAKQHFYQKPPTLNKLDPMIPVKVAQLVNKMLAKRPDQRHQSMEELLRCVWEVRQITAPEKELVPDVHTISIRRLDYNLQAVSKAKREQLKAGMIEEKKKIGLIVRFVVLSIPVILLAAILFYGWNYRKSMILAEKIREVDQFDVLRRDPNLSYKYLEERCGEIMDSLGTPQNDAERFLNTRLRLHLAEIQNIKLVQENEKLQASSQCFQKETEKAQKETKDMENLKDTFAAALARKYEELKNKENYIAKFADNVSIVKERNKLKKDMEDQKNLFDKLSREYEEYWKNDVRIKIYAMILQARFDEASAMLKDVSNSKPEIYKGWFLSKITLIEKMEKLYPLVFNSGIKYAGTQVEEGKIIKIANGDVTLQESSGNFTVKKWNALNVKSLFAIVKNEFNDYDERTLKSSLLMLAGRPGEAQKVFPSNPEISRTCAVLCKNTLDNIRYLALSDRKKASVKAQLFIKEFSEMDGFEQYAAEVAAILGKDFQRE